MFGEVPRRKTKKRTPSHVGSTSESRVYEKGGKAFVQENGPWRDDYLARGKREFS